MRVEKKNVLVGIILDGQSRQLLNWAIVKVAEPGDCVIAVHVVRTLGKQFQIFLHLICLFR